MEKQQERRKVREIELEGGQPSRNSGQTGLEPDEHRIDIVKISPREYLIESLKKAEESTQSQSQWQRIPKVPLMLRGTQNLEKLWEPSLISIGPYHYGKPHLHEGEMIKPRYAQKFLADSDQRVEALYTKIGSNIEALRKCYDWSSTKEYDDEELACMMLLDGCFLLQFIRSRVYTSRVNMSNGLRNHQINFVKQDLFLLENQLPFGVLKLIFEEAKFHGALTMEDMIGIFITPDNGTQLEAEDIEPSHLLDLLRSALLGRYKKISKQELGSQPEQEQEAEKNGESSSSRGRDGGFCCSWKKGKQQGNWASFRHIKELKAAGIYVKPSRTSFLTDISFKSYFFCRYLKLPQIIIDDFTKSNFLNMVAYEMCPDAPDDYTVTSYVCFLYELIYDADDVKELRSKHILYNFLGSDEDVVKFFNEIADGLVDPDAYIHVKARIQKHYYKRVNTWIAGGLQEYFRYPWSFTGFIAAVWILILTSLQTYYAHPGKQMMIIYMGLFGVPIFLLVVWYIVRLLWD